MSTKSWQNGRSAESRPLPVPRTRSESKLRGNDAGASERFGSAFLPARGAAQPPAWVVDAPLLPGEPGVHIASRLGIVAVEAPSEFDAPCGSRCCGRRGVGPACSRCHVNRPRSARDDGDAT